MKSAGFINENKKTFSESTGLSKEDVEELYEELVLFLKDALPQMRAAEAKQDYAALKVLAHQVKGAAGNLMVATLFELAEDLEKAVMIQDSKACSTRISDIHNCFEAF